MEIDSDSFVSEKRPYSDHCMNGAACGLLYTPHIARFLKNFMISTSSVTLVEDTFPFAIIAARTSDYITVFYFVIEFEE